MWGVVDPVSLLIGHHCSHTHTHSTIVSFVGNFHWLHLFSVHITLISLLFCLSSSLTFKLDVISSKKIILFYSTQYLTWIKKHTHTDTHIVREDGAQMSGVRSPLPVALIGIITWPVLWVCREITAATWGISASELAKRGETSENNNDKCRSRWTGRKE